VDYVLADVFGWQPPRRYDSVFFAFWLSRVPPERFDDFWAAIEQWLAARGRVAFVEEADREGAGNEVYTGPGGHVVVRRLRDGSTHRVVKVFAGPEEIGHRVSRAGWHSAVRQAGRGWLVGEAWPIRSRPTRPRAHQEDVNWQSIGTATDAVAIAAT